MQVMVEMEQITPRNALLLAIQQNALAFFGYTGVLFTSVVEVLRLFASEYYVFDLFRHIPLQAAFALGVVLLWGLLSRRHSHSFKAERAPKHQRWWWPMFFLFGLQLFRVLPFFVPYASHDEVISPEKEVSLLSVLSANLLFGNMNLAPLLQWATVKDPDVIVLIEVSQKQMKVLEPLLRRYPHRLLKPSPYPAGMALFSKHPFREKSMVPFNHSPTALRVVLNIASRGQKEHLIEVWAVHPMPPVSREMAKSRDGALHKWGDMMRHAKHPLVVVGDFNATPWSATLNDFQEVTQLDNAAKGHGGETTWPSFFPAPLRIPIDHILRSKPLVTRSFEVGPHMGSDHLPVFAELELHLRAGEIPTQ